MFVGPLAVALVATSEAPYPYLTFSRSPAFDRRITIVDVGSLEHSGDEWGYWFRRTVKLGKASATWWTDTTRCSAARWVVEQAINVPAPRVAVPGVDDPSLEQMTFTADGVGYSMDTGGHYAGRMDSKLHFTSNVGTPLAAWVDESLRRLEPCWSKKTPAEPML